jgi:hypothetical protein
MGVLSGLALDCATHKKASTRAIGYRPGRRTGRCETASWDAGAAGPSKPAPRRLEAIEAQICDEIAVMQGVMISDLRQDEHLVRLGAPEVRRVIEVRIGEPGVHAIAVIERAFEVGHDFGLRTRRSRRGGVRFTLDV